MDRLDDRVCEGDVGGRGVFRVSTRWESGDGSLRGSAGQKPVTGVRREGTLQRGR